jgi:hypothetical protein
MPLSCQPGNFEASILSHETTNKMNRFLISAVVLLVTVSLAKAQTFSKDPTVTKRNQFSVLFGLNQPIVLHGFNFEVDYWTKKWVFDYSHGIGLNMTGRMVSSEYENQKVNFKITHSMGIGAGYRFTNAFNVRFEPKMHIYETYYDGQKQVKSNSIANFTTYTLGFGAYYKWLPFGGKTNALKGISIVPSVRYWYQVASTLKNDRLTYSNAETKRDETLKAPNIGIANTPLLVNVSIGYTF